MASATMPTSPGRGGHNFVPHSKPTYAPKGYYRCMRCNSIIQEGTECECSKRRDKASGEVRTTYQEPQRVRDTREDKKAYKEAKQRREKVYTFVKNEPDCVKKVCVDCGEVFMASLIGRPPKWCHACRKRRENERQRLKRARRRQ